VIGREVAAVQAVEGVEKGPMGWVRL
jgi:hypothetical protein